MSPLPETFFLYRAPWVLPIVTPAISDGAVLCSAGRIVSVGSAVQLQQEFPQAVVHHCDGVLMPGLVNAHCHLELSHLDQISQPNETGSMCDWIQELLACRFQDQDTTVARTAARRALIGQYESGVALLLDIGNDESCLADYSVQGLERLFLLECLAATTVSEQQALATIKQLPDTALATAHALYSTRPELLTTLKQRADRMNHVFSLHLAESIDEMLFLGDGRGCFANFLAERGAADFPVPRTSMQHGGVTEILADLGLLSENLLCVHGVHLTQQDLDRLAHAKASVCLCPGSNRFLKVGMAPVTQMLVSGLLPALGTDSIASNETLDIWREVQFIREDHPEIPPETVLAMATLGGARALGRANDYGSLVPGKKAQLLHVVSSALCEASNSVELLDVLTTAGRPQDIDWLDGSSDEPSTMMVNNGMNR
ncbi:MAG: amidohydrolase family protein [Desulfobulbaceae bacterium]|uniref:Amidohydrolase family protein n=1 Tax=Candidatus Desulfatifera sulfidica TaxID=2841691 RepID=A0A8J6N898_9BACT|nr:amidohydrolase family protein [Candidatus Desulfatifera sulfidica]